MAGTATVAGATARVQLLIFFNAFGDVSIMRKFLSDFSICQNENGLFPSVCYGGTGRLSFVDYALWWACGLCAMS